jgi:TPP-dependent pyruvate/acetoin dehydrogenase alpha subunit
MEETSWGAFNHSSTFEMVRSSIILDGMNTLDSYQLFKEVHEKVYKTKRPVIIEAKTQRFKGLSRSDTEYYRSQDDMEAIRH